MCYKEHFATQLKKKQIWPAVEASPTYPHRTPGMSAIDSWTSSAIWKAQTYTKIIYSRTQWDLKLTWRQSHHFDCMKSYKIRRLVNLRNYVMPLAPTLLQRVLVLIWKICVPARQTQHHLAEYLHLQGISRSCLQLKQSHPLIMQLSLFNKAWGCILAHLPLRTWSV